MTPTIRPKTWRDRTGIPLTVRQPSIWKSVYELVDGDEVVTTLTYPRILSWAGRSEGADGCWDFRHRGFWKPVVEVTACGEKRPVTRFAKGHFSRTHAIKLPGYKTVRLTSNMWMNEYRLTSGMNQEILTLRMKVFSLSRGELTIDPRALQFEETSWLVPLVMYVAILGQRSKAHAG